MTDGIILVNKTSGMTSHDVVAQARRKLSIKKVGHAGTLDPLATGLLILLIGKGTKLSDQFLGMDKAYRSTLILGITTDTGDTQGKILSEKNFESITSEQLHSAFDNFIGEGEQLPPMYSAVKHKGKKLYELARKGITVERKPRAIRIDTLNIEKEDLPNVQFYMECSKGTYVRQLAMDIGAKLGCGACISQLERVKIGPFDLNESVNLEDIDESCIRNFECQTTS